MSNHNGLRTLYHHGSVNRASRGTDPPKITRHDRRAVPTVSALNRPLMYFAFVCSMSVVELTGGSDVRKDV